MPMILSRVELSRSDAQRRALAAQLAQNAIADGGHALMSMLFPDATARSFLWREDRRAARFSAIILSPHAPLDALGIFDITSKEFAPEFVAGDSLSFVLRVNAVVRRRDESGRVQKHDVAMHALRTEHGDQRPQNRQEIADRAVMEWFARQGERHGFRAEQEDVGLVGAEQRSIGKRRSKFNVQFTEFDLQGTLAVVDPDAFTSMLATGLGAARAYGCGLMLVRRAE